MEKKTDIIYELTEHISFSSSTWCHVDATNGITQHFLCCLSNANSVEEVLKFCGHFTMAQFIVRIITRGIVVAQFFAF
jgi:hypothetical protein